MTDLVAGRAEELRTLTIRLEESVKQIGMLISSEKSKVMRIWSNDELDVSIDCKNLETVTQFKYLGATITEDTRSVQQIKSGLLLLHHRFQSLRPYLRTSMKTRIRLFRALVVSVFLYGCETWTSNAEMEKCSNSLAMNYMRRLLQVHYTLTLPTNRSGNWSQAAYWNINMC